MEPTPTPTPLNLHSISSSVGPQPSPVNDLHNFGQQSGQLSLLSIIGIAVGSSIISVLLVGIAVTASCVAVGIRKRRKQVKLVPDLPIYDQINKDWTIIANANSQLDEVV